MKDVGAFFGKGYTKKKRDNQTLGYMKVIRGEDLPESDVPEAEFIEPEKSPWPEVHPSEDSNVAVNVMGDLYEGKDKIEMVAGDIIVDGIRTGKMPCTSGTWFKILKGTQKIKKSILTIIESCDTMEGVDKEGD